MTRALLRLFLLHLSTPVMFVVILYAGLPMMDTSELPFALCVLLREVIYIALIISVVWRQPSFLFFDVMANVAVGKATLAVTFVLSPDLMLAGSEVLKSGACIDEILLRPTLLILDTVAILALLVQLLSGSMFLPLAILYFITGLSAAWTFLALIFDENEVIEGIRATLYTARRGLGSAFCHCLVRGTQVAKAATPLLCFCYALQVWLEPALPISSETTMTTSPGPQYCKATLFTCRYSASEGSMSFCQKWTPNSVCWEGTCYTPASCQMSQVVPIGGTSYEGLQLRNTREGH